jgi:hypothetical protein
MPSAWRGKVDDPQLTKWLREYEQRRSVLPADPGPGTFKRSFRLDKKTTEKLSGGDLSAFLRRLIALHLSSSPHAVVAPRNVDRSPSALAPSRPKRKQVQPPRPSPSSQKSSRTPEPKARTTPNAQAGIPPDMPPILWKPCLENHYSPLWRNGALVRDPIYPEEKVAFRQLMHEREEKDRLARSCRLTHPLE